MEYLLTQFFDLGGFSWRAEAPIVETDVEVTACAIDIIELSFRACCPNLGLCHCSRAIYSVAHFILKILFIFYLFLKLPYHSIN